MSATPFSLRAVLDDNLSGLRVDASSSVRDAHCTGEGFRLSDDTPVLRVGDRLLGAPLAVDEVRLRVEDRPGPGPIVVFGWGFGHVARAVREETDDPIVVFDPDPGLLRTALEQGPSDVGGFEVFTSLHELTQAWPGIARDRTSATLFRTPGYADSFPEQLAELETALEALVQRAGVNANTWDLRARTWIEDVLDNVDVLAEVPTFLALDGQLEGVPAFIVGSGPSLGKNIEQVRLAAQKGLVFCMNSSARALAAAGIDPQVIVCIESIDVSHRMEDLPFLDQAIRAFSLTGHPKVMRTGSGPLLPVYEAVEELSGPLAELTGRRGLGVCGSVSTVAFSLAERLGCSPIVLVGQDMAYTEGRAYAPGTGYESSTARVDRDAGTVRFDWNHEVHEAHGTSQGAMAEREPLFEVPAWGGDGKVPTGASLGAVRAWFEGASALLGATRPNLRLINATEGGANVAGFDEVPLVDVLAGLDTESPSTAELVRRAKEASPPLSTADLARWAERQRWRSRKARLAAKRVRKLAEHSLSASRGGDPGSVSRAFEALAQAEASLKTAVTKARFVEAWSHQAVGEAMAQEDEPVGTQERAERALRGEAAVAGAVERAAKELEGALRRVETRLTEQSRDEHQGRQTQWH